MREKEKDINSIGGSQVKSCHVPSRPSLFRTLEEVKEQVDYEDFGEKMASGKFYIDGLYREVCLIIAEMYVKPPESIVRIRGSEIEACIVQEVYRELRHEHIEHVVDRFKEQTGLVYKKTPYLQTALYNVLFEYEAHFTNLVKHDLYGG